MRAIVRTLAYGYLIGRFHVRGANRVPRSGPVIVCANHGSTIDPPLVPAFLPRADSWSMGKAEWFLPGTFTRWLFTRYHAFPVVRHSADMRAIRRAMEVLRAGEVLVMYPEGTRVEAGGLKAGEPGAGFLARTSAAAVQPLALLGTRECFPKGARWPRRAHVELRFGRPFRIRERRPDGRRVENQEAVDAIMLAIANELPVAARGAYSDVDGLRDRLAEVIEPL
jgi:1-acyl-sn-glycerol-3-phosphate acyltransferase